MEVHKVHFQIGGRGARGRGGRETKT